MSTLFAHIRSGPTMFGMLCIGIGMALVPAYSVAPFDLPFQTAALFVLVGIAVGIVLLSPHARSASMYGVAVAALLIGSIGTSAWLRGVPLQSFWNPSFEPSTLHYVLLAVGCAYVGYSYFSSRVRLVAVGAIAAGVPSAICIASFFGAPITPHGSLVILCGGALIIACFEFISARETSTWILWLIIAVVHVCAVAAALTQMTTSNASWKSSFYVVAREVSDKPMRALTGYSSGTFVGAFDRYGAAPSADESPRFAASTIITSAVADGVPLTFTIVVLLIVGLMAAQLPPNTQWLIRLSCAWYLIGICITHPQPIVFAYLGLWFGILWGEARTIDRSGSFNSSLAVSALGILALVLTMIGVRNLGALVMAQHAYAATRDHSIAVEEVRTYLDRSLRFAPLPEIALMRARIEISALTSLMNRVPLSDEDRAYAEVLMHEIDASIRFADYRSNEYSTEIERALAAMARSLIDGPDALMDARAAYINARGYRPDDVSVRVSEAQIALRLGEVDRARSLLREALRRDPMSREARGLLDRFPQ